MNIEENRLRTFNSWSNNGTLLNTRHLARAGFFATDKLLETQCFYCQCRISDWLIGDNIDERHKELSPFCPKINARVTCSVSSEPNNSSNALSVNSKPKQPVDLHVEFNRLATFKNWPNPNISPQSLAKAGFFYLNRSDEVECAWCKGVIAKWEKQDNAFEEHKRFFPDCPRVQFGPLIELTTNGIRGLGIQKISTAMEPKYSSLDARLRTYTNWPIGDIQQPAALAQAGLYYQNFNDHVRCYHCNIGLRSWQKEDDPWFEHAKWYPQCEFVRLVKGNNYVQKVQELTRSASKSSNSQTSTLTIEEAMSTPAVLQALEMGIDGGAIRNITQRQISKTGQPYATVEDLIKAIFDGWHDESNEFNDRISDSEGAAAVINNFEIINRDNHIINNDNSNSANETSRNNSEYAYLYAEQANTTLNANIVDDTKDALNVNENSTSNPNIHLSFERSLSLEEENRKLKDARLCKVCLDEEVGVVFLPCGHLVTCVQCAPTVSQCPMCRSSIKGFVRTFLS